MTLTLGQAKPLLASSASNGICATDSRLVELINEAQRRLYVQGPWLGSLTRYLVATSVANDGTTTFALPAVIENPSRINKYTFPTPSPTTAGVLISDGIGAFVGQTGSVVPINYNLPDTRTFQVPRGLAAVEVTGPKVYSDAVNDTDLLFITDISALKFMLLALWREKNDRLDLATALEKKATDRLSEILNTAIDESRRLTFQTANGSAIYGTVGWARVKLCADFRQGVTRDDPYLLDLLNKAEDLLVSRYNFFILNNRLGVKDNLPKLEYQPLFDDSTPLPVKNYSTLRIAAASILAANTGDANSLQAAQALEQQAYDLLDKELQVNLCESRRAIYEAEFEEFRDTPGLFGYFRTRLALDLPGDMGVMMTNEELVRKINEAEEFAMTQGSFKNMRRTITFTVQENGIILLPSCVESVLMASIGGRARPVWGSEFDYSPNGYGYGDTICLNGGDRLVDRGELNGRRQYFVRDWCAPECAHFLYKARFLVKHEDGEQMVVTNFPVMRMLVEAGLTTDPNTKIGLQKTALAMLAAELKEHQGTNRASLIVDDITSMGRIPALT